VPRTIAIGDIHGCLLALERLLQAVGTSPDDTIVTLGDYVDRGPDSAGTIERLIALVGEVRLVPLLGNHDQMLLDAYRHPAVERDWLACGGVATLASYGVDQPARIPAAHIGFLRGCRSFLELENQFFVHANYLPKLPLADQTEETLYWLSLRDRVPGPHISGRMAIVGHTPQADILNLGHLVGIDTGCVYGGWLSALDVDSGHVWQTNQSGQLREAQVALKQPGETRKSGIAADGRGRKSGN
jgi:serine/threonine protein phosphatase 1